MKIKVMNFVKVNELFLYHIMRFKNKFIYLHGYNIIELINYTIIMKPNKINHTVNASV